MCHAVTARYWAVRKPLATGAEATRPTWWPRFSKRVARWPPC